VRKPAPVVAAEKPAPAEKPAAKEKETKPASVASSKPANKTDKARGKGWVDPFAE
jgi:hypothetical protein